MDIRLKLNVNYDLDVQNVWLSLNYEKNPTISHLVNHLVKNFNIDSGDVRLYMDEFWLPPWESSRILRENDCLKVVIGKSENGKNIEDFSDDKLKKSESLELKKKPKDTNLVAKSSSANFFDNSESLKQKDSKLNDKINLFDTNNYNINAAKTTADKLNLNSDNKQTNKNSNQSKAKNTNKKNKNAENNLNEPQQQSKKMHSKFAVGNYVHLLTEEPQEEYNGNDELYNEQPNDEFAYQSQSVGGDVEKIASSVNSTAKYKWKNSNKPVTTKAPTHIIFESTEESSSPSSSDSSSSTSETSSTSELNNSVQKKGKQKKVNKDAAKKENNVAEKSAEAKKEINKPKLNNEKANKLPVSQSENNLNKKQQQNKKQLKTKEEQLNAVNYNRSFVVQNPNDINAFEKVFNETKHKSPMKPKKQRDQDQSKDAKKQETSEQQQMELQKEKEPEIEKAKYDFEKLDPLLGAPTVGQIIAFQVLELTKDFTPEISPYKTGNVKKFDAINDEITLKLDQDYNKVLKVPNKFTIVRRNSAESSESSDSYEEPDENEHEHIFNWKDLLNVKVIPRNMTQNQME